jgi:hypothetical protein
LGKPDSADKRGPLSAKERKEKKKKRKKKKALAHGSGFSLNLTTGPAFSDSGSREPRPNKTRKLFKLSAETEKRSVRAFRG